MTDAETAIAPTMALATEILDEMTPVGEEDVIPLLQKLQEAYGYLPKEVVLEVAARTGLAASRLFGVATFYEQFHLAPRGRHIVRCCRGTACHVRGARNIVRVLERELLVEEGATTPDRRFTFETVACLGTCFLAPVIMVNNDYYGKVAPGRIKKILDQYK